MLSENCRSSASVSEDCQHSVFYFSNICLKTQFLALKPNCKETNKHLEVMCIYKSILKIIQHLVQPLKNFSGKLETIIKLNTYCCSVAPNTALTVREGTLPDANQCQYRNIPIIKECSGNNFQFVKNFKLIRIRKKEFLNQLS